MRKIQRPFAKKNDSTFDERAARILIVDDNRIGPEVTGSFRFSFYGEEHVDCVRFAFHCITSAFNMNLNQTMG
jgi:hypothetical protein